MKKNKGKTLCIIIYVLTVIVGAAGGYLLYRFAGSGSDSQINTCNKIIEKENLYEMDYTAFLSPFGCFLPLRRTADRLCKRRNGSNT